MSPTYSLIEGFLAYIDIEKGLSKNTIASYRFDLARLDAWTTAQGKTLPELTRVDLQAWIAALGREGLNPPSIARAVSAVRGFFRFLYLDGHVRLYPAVDLPTPTAMLKLPRFLNEDEIERLLSAPNVETDEGIRDRTMLEVLYASGVRVSELVALREYDINLNARLLLAHGKGNKMRYVPIGRSAVDWLKRYAAMVKGYERKQHWPVFETRYHEPLARTTVWGIVRNYALQVGLKNVSPHTLRHTYATHLMQRGVDCRSLQLLLGHANLSTTQIYTHITSHRLQASYTAHHPRKSSQT